MEEVWKDITTLSSAHQSHIPAATAAHHQSSLHEFLASAVYPPTESCDPSQQLSKKASVKKVTHRIRPEQNYGGFCCSQNSPTLSSVMGSSLFTPQCSSLKRDSEDDNAGGDRRYKRKMKNRESATRSRARRQAYTNELELEVAHLREENAMLRRRQEEIRSAAAAGAEAQPQAPKKSTLVRTLTAPF